MQKTIHPKTQLVTYVCGSCSTKYPSISTSNDDITVEVCANCHPFYTGVEGVAVDADSRIDKFLKQQSAVIKDVKLRKRRKLESRKSKTNETKAEKKLTLNDMLKQK